MLVYTVPCLHLVYCSCRTLEVLQDRAEPHPFWEVERVLRNELGDAADELLANLDHVAAAAASLAQACLARDLIC